MKRLATGPIECLPPAGMPASATIEACLAPLAPLFEAVPAAAGERHGALLLVSEDAGSATAVQFWRDALDTGPALASPAAFPWCLANAPCGALARRFGVTGPNITWLVSSLDDPVAFDAPVAALGELAAGAQGTPVAWLVAWRESGPSPRLVAWRFDFEVARPPPLDDGRVLARHLAEGWLAAPEC